MECVCVYVREREKERERERERESNEVESSPDKNFVVKRQRNATIGSRHWL